MTARGSRRVTTDPEMNKGYLAPLLQPGSVFRGGVCGTCYGDIQNVGAGWFHVGTSGPNMDLSKTGGPCKIRPPKEKA